MVQLPAKEFHIAARGIGVREVPDNEFSLWSQMRAESGEEPDKEGIGKIVKKASRPDKVIGMRGEEPTHIAMNEVELGEKGMAEALGIVQSLKIVINAINVHSRGMQDFKRFKEISSRATREIQDVGLGKLQIVKHPDLFEKIGHTVADSFDGGLCVQKMVPVREHGIGSDRALIKALKDFIVARIAMGLMKHKPLNRFGREGISKRLHHAAKVIR